MWFTNKNLSCRASKYLLLVEKVQKTDRTTRFLVKYTLRFRDRSFASGIGVSFPESKIIFQNRRFVWNLFLQFKFQALISEKKFWFYKKCFDPVKASNLNCIHKLDIMLHFRKPTFHSIPFWK